MSVILLIAQRRDVDRTTLGGDSPPSVSVTSGARQKP
jgi:hypothetical protein